MEKQHKYIVVLTSSGLDGLKIKSNGNKALFIDCLGFLFTPVDLIFEEEVD
jgi:hypothetical protein